MPNLILTVTENGYGKRTPVDEYRLQSRGGKGIINVKTTERNGKVVGILLVSESVGSHADLHYGKIIRMDTRLHPRSRTLHPGRPTAAPGSRRQGRSRRRDPAGRSGERGTDAAAVVA